jgi:hypothetical protein
MSENTTTDRGVSALHETVPWSDGIVISPTRIPSTDGVPAVTGSETGNGEVKAPSMASDVLALRSRWRNCRRTTQGSRRDHAGVDA